MERQAAIERLLELYDNPTHLGPMEDADATAKGGNPGCGDIVDIHIKVNDAGHVEQIMFEGEGCTISQAAAELVSDKMQGATLDEIEALDHDVIIDELGRDIVISRPRCATLALGTLKQAVHEYKSRVGAGQA